jgi:predicted RNA-binding Zn ribbon-like protein
VDLTRYASLAVRLANTAADAGCEPDWLGTADTLRAFAAEQQLTGPCAPVTHHDLDALRMLRAELSAIFLAAAERDYAAAAGRLNALLVQFPVRPTLVQHGRRSGWHLHLDDSGSLADKYAAGAVAGLATLVSQFGMNHLGICAMPGCRGVFADASPGRPGRYCADHCGSNANVTALRNRRNSAARYPASTAAG